LIDSRGFFLNSVGFQTLSITHIFEKAENGFFGDFFLMFEQGLRGVKGPKSKNFTQLLLFKKATRDLWVINRV